MYKFTLDPLLNHRRLLEEGLQRELADLESKRQAVEHRLEAVEHALTTCGVPGAGPDGACPGAGMLQLRALRLQHLAREREIWRQRLAAATKASATKRAELIEIVKSRKIIEKLKEKGLREYRATESRKEQAFLNEMAVLRHRR
jgi:flagellar export protein FliJ